MSAGEAGDDAKDLKLTRLRERMLEGHEPSRQRYLADKDKAVIQQYTSESTYDGKSEGLSKGTNTIGTGAKTTDEGSPAAAIAGGVVVVGGLATVGYLVLAKKACFAPKVPTGNPVPSQPV